MRFYTHTRLIISIIAALCMCVAVVAWQGYVQLYSPLLKIDETPIIVTLERNETAYQFAHALEDKKIIPSAKVLLWLIRYHQFAHKLKAGVYQINPGDSLTSLLDKIVSGNVIVQNFTIIEGTTQKKVDEDLRKANYLTYQSDVWNTLKNGYNNSEGMLLADTYQYHGGSSSQQLLMQAHESLMKVLDANWNSRSLNLPYKTPYELLIAASIIEKESAISQERKLISGVLINRLRKKMPLQMDPTVIYGLGIDYKGKLSHQDLLIDSPYNSYLNRGLPPTPISMVGKEAIDAAAHPQLSNYLYYVAKGDGSHQFSETYEQQKQAINQYRRKDY